MDMENQPFDVTRCVEEALDLLAPRAVEKGLETACLIDEDLPVFFVGDVARANLIAATRRGLQSAALNICTGKATSLNELFAAIHTHYPAAPAPAYAPARRGEIRHSRGDPALARDILDFSAATTVESGLGSLLADHSPAET